MGLVVLRRADVVDELLDRAEAEGALRRMAESSEGETEESVSWRYKARRAELSSPFDSDLSTHECTASRTGRGGRGR